MTDEQPPQDVPDTPEHEPAAETTPALPPWPHWVYTGLPGRVYTVVPVTPEPEDVIAWPQCPSTDGCWQPTEAEVTRLPDNFRLDPAEEHAAAVAAKAEPGREG